LQLQVNLFKNHGEDCGSSLAGVSPAFFPFPFPFLHMDEHALVNIQPST
jgi:hypothetical protein